MRSDAPISVERTVVADDTTALRTRSDGEQADPTLLLCNSLGTDLSLWDPQLPAWTVGRRVLRFDQRGHGGSGVGSGPYTLDRLGRDALAVLDAHEVATADVCGISLGGLVAQWLALHAPERVRRVVVADTAARVGTEAAWRDRAALVRREGMAAVHDQVLERFFSPAFRASGDPHVSRVGALLLGTDPEGYAASCEALATADLRGALDGVTAPTLVIVGEDDVATTPDDAAALTAALPDARLVVLPGAGHLANLERPERFAAIVADHLDGAGSSGRGDATDRAGGGDQ